VAIRQIQLDALRSSLIACYASTAGNILRAVGNSGGPHLNRPLAELFRYNKWATHTLLDACRGLTPDQLEASAASGPVCEVLIHLVGSQQTFILRTRGRQHEGELSRQSPWPSIESLIEVALNTSDELIEIAEALDEDVEVDLPYMGRVYRFPRSFFLVHALEHGVEHRTEIKIALSQLGVETPDLDGWTYATAAGFGKQV
jgi:uncharacterized damage-inducible protein DinB